VDRVFLDANVLFSAAYSNVNRLLRLWQIDGIELISSAFALTEALRNLTGDDQRECLHKLLRQIRIVPEPPQGSTIAADVDLPPKDIPILQAAISGQATHLLTGDKRHFGPLFGAIIGGVLILRPSEYFAIRSD
jgi:predicted nucleic acid-binding protein